MTDATWEALSEQALAACGVVYFLALLAHLVEWSALRRLPVRAPASFAAATLAGSGRTSAPDSALVGEGERRPGLGEGEGRSGSSAHAALFGRLGVLLTGLAAGVQLVALAGRGLAADPGFPRSTGETST